MREQLLAYLLNELEPVERQEVERAIQQNPELAVELDQMRSCLQEKESTPAEPPKKLAERTCSFVKKAVEHAECSASGQLVTKSLSDANDCVGKRTRWSLADLAVGTGVVLALVALLLPALHESRDVSRRLQCQNNLYTLGSALVEFSERFGQGLPQIKKDEPAGKFAYALAEHGVLSRDLVPQLVVCPETELAEKVFSGCVVIRVPTEEELQRASTARRHHFFKLLGGNYAYGLGFEDDVGEIHQFTFVRSSEVPMLADSPSHAVPGFQSANHGTCGQNVIFQDLSCRYCKQCFSARKKDHWFLNDDGKHAAGRHPQDIVLGRSDATPRLTHVD